MSLKLHIFTNVYSLVQTFVNICSFSDIKTPEDGSVRSRNMSGFFKWFKELYSFLK
jgi:hypothetical protein